jgi:hypothetical protein|tara:strand:- start:190 stop:708 length:519 start_codon:yes stop_codon:yes gene_type:complete
MVEQISTGLTKNTNNRIIQELYRAENWRYGSDNRPEEKHLDRRDAGFILSTYDVNFNYHKNDILNTLGQVIFDMVEKNTHMRFKKIDRICFNWYHTGSMMEFHQDIDLHNKFSIIYNIHDNDGGTEFKVNDKVKFYQSKGSEALLFPSKIEHRGVAPKENLNRFCMNMMLEI